MENTKNPAATLADLGITLTAAYLPHTAKAGESLSLRWRVTVVRNGRGVCTTEYTAGCAHAPEYRTNGGKVTAAVINECATGLVYNSTRPVPPPDVADVVYCLLSDADGTDEVFEDWCGNLGFDPDSRKAEAIYNACRDIAAALRRSFTPAELDRLRDAFADY